jgi:type II secretory pathway pseudopilin PulG
MRMAASAERGYAMAALLVGMAVMGIMMSVALPVWQTAARREREAELVFRGQQYVQAIELFSRRTGGLPLSFDMLEDGKFLRKRYKDPITGQDFQPVYLGQVAAGTPGQAGRAGTPGQTGQQTQAGTRGAQGTLQTGRGAPLAGRGGTATQIPGALGRGPQPPLVSGQVGGQGTGPIIGVVSTSTEEGLRVFNGRGRYNEWLFVSTAATTQAGGRGGNPPQQNQTGGRRGAPPSPFGRGNAPGQGMRGGGGRGLTLPPMPQTPGTRGRGPGL